MDLHWLSSPVAKHELQWSVLTFFSCTLKVKFVLKLWQQKSLPSSTRKLLMLSWSFFNRFYLVLTGIDDPLWCVSFLWFFLLGFMKRFGQLWSLLMINLDQNKLSPKGSKTKQAWRVSSGLSYLSFVLKPEGKSGLVTLQRGLEDGVMFFAAICGQEVDCDCNPLQLCTFKLPASSLKAESNALDILCDGFGFFLSPGPSGWSWRRGSAYYCRGCSLRLLRCCSSMFAASFFPTNKPRLFQNLQEI